MTKSKENLMKILKKTDFARKPLKEDVKASSEYRWNEKKVEKSLTIFNPEENAIYPLPKSLTTFEETDFICPLTNHKSIKIPADASLVTTLYPPTYGATLKFEDLNLEEYNRISFYVYIKATGYRSFFWNITIGDNIKGFKIHDYHHDPSIEPNKWVRITWELGLISRSNITKMTIIPFVGGNPPEAFDEVDIYLNDVVAEKVVADYEEGWDLENRIAYSHVGYFYDAKKIALVQNIKKKDFCLKNEKNEICYLGKAKEIKTDFGFFYELDFTNYKNEGDYYLEIEDKKTDLFVIDSNPYLSSIWISLSFLKSLRCGEEVTGIHSACHLNCRTVHEDGRSLPNFGGWHDAGDLSQFEICTAEMAHALLELCEIVKDDDLYNRILEEAKVGLSWLVRTRFGDGTRSLAVSYNMWQRNVLQKDRNGTISKAENGPFENFLAAAAEAKGAKLFKEEDQIFADWNLRSAIEDYNFAKTGYKARIFTKRWGSNIDSQVCGSAILAAIELYKVTNDNKYLNDAKEYAKVVISCQQQETPDWEKPLRGFFYEDPEHQYVLNYEHRGHEQTPVQGLAVLCENFPNDDDYSTWEKSLKLYAEYVNKTLEYTKPYGLVPGHVYINNKVNFERITVPAYYGTLEEGKVDLYNQVNEGIKLAEGVYLRIFPVAVQRRGYHATLLSKAKGISLIARILNNKSLMQVALDQLEWVMGKNPFSSSGMYGEGYNYHPLYVAYSGQMMGALPVGIKTYGDNDKPYWPVINNSVFKEVWGHTTGKYLWVLYDILKYNE